MVMRSEHCIYMLECEGVNDERHVAEVRLHRAAAAHVSHLVANLHLAIAMRALAIAAPEVNRYVGTARRLEPNARAAQPPHGNLTFRNNRLLDVLNEPGAPFRERAVNPGFSRHFTNLAHFAPPNDVNKRNEHFMAFCLLLCSLLV